MSTVLVSICGGHVPVPRGASPEQMAKIVISHYHHLRWASALTPCWHTPVEQTLCSPGERPVLSLLLSQLSYSLRFVIYLREGAWRSSKSVTVQAERVGSLNGRLFHHRVVRGRRLNAQIPWFNVYVSRNAQFGAKRAASITGRSCEQMCSQVSNTP